MVERGLDSHLVLQQLGALGIRTEPIRRHQDNDDDAGEDHKSFAVEEGDEREGMVDARVLAPSLLGASITCTLATALHGAMLDALEASILVSFFPVTSMSTCLVGLLCLLACRLGHHSYLFLVSGFGLIAAVDLKLLHGFHGNRHPPH